MRIIISGGSGMIGRALTEALLREGHQPAILSRKPDQIKPFPQGVQVIPWNGSGAGNWQAEFEGADAVVNLAGASIAGSGLLPQRWTPERKQSILQSRVRSGRILSETLRRLENPPPVFLQASAIGFYGPHGDEFLYENRGPGNDFLADVCQQWEASSRDLPPGTRRIVTRIGLVLNRDSGLLPLIRLPFRFYLGGPLGTGQQYMSWIHMEDLIRSMLFLLEDERSSGIYNLTAPHPVTNREFARTLGRLMHRPSVVPVPALALRLLLGEAAGMALDGQRVLPRQLLSAGFNFTFDTAEQALADLLT